MKNCSVDAKQISKSNNVDQVLQFGRFRIENLKLLAT